MSVFWSVMPYSLVTGTAVLKEHDALFSTPKIQVLSPPPNVMTGLLFSC